MKPATLRPAAEQDLMELTRWYAEQGGLGLVERFFDEARAALREAEGMPGIGSPRRGCSPAPGSGRSGHLTDHRKSHSMAPQGHNEADTRAKLSDPALYKACWVESVSAAERATHGEIRREQCAVRVEIIDGKPFKRGCGRVDEVGGQYRRRM